MCGIPIQQASPLVANKPIIGESDAQGKQRPVLTDLQYQMCDATICGYDLRDKRWEIFDVDRIRDINFNTQPFDSLVLPQGYKDLILSFVENQLKDGDTFDDVINGKGKQSESITLRYVLTI